MGNGEFGNVAFALTSDAMRVEIAECVRRWHQSLRETLRRAHSLVARSKGLLLVILKGLRK